MQADQDPALIPNGRVGDAGAELALHQIANKWTMPIRDRQQAMTQLMSLCGERLEQ
ncbi:MAG: hypothetical protein LRY38_05635 [Aeromonadaceae bacterium]|nr:hypothetical protein [Aeromonadaceae bacterium]